MNETHVYTVAGAKGGVGKTTTSINLGASLAAAGYSTVVVELDLAMANLVDFLDVDIDVSEAATLHDVLAGTTDLDTATYETDPGFAVVPSGTDLGGYAATDLERLPDAVETLRWRYDVVLLDTPAGLSEETVRPLQLADEALLVSTPRVASIRNVQNTMELADRVDTPIRGLVLTKSGTGSSPGADRIAAFLDVELLGHVPEDEAVPHSQDKGLPVVSNAPRSGAAIAYRKIGRALVDLDPTEVERVDESVARSPAEPNGPDRNPSGGPERPATARHGTTDGGRVIEPQAVVGGEGAAAERDEDDDTPADEYATADAGDHTSTESETEAPEGTDAETDAPPVGVSDGDESRPIVGPRRPESDGHEEADGVVNDEGAEGYDSDVTAGEGAPERAGDDDRADNDDTVVDETTDDNASESTDADLIVPDTESSDSTEDGADSGSDGEAIGPETEPEQRENEISGVTASAETGGRSVTERVRSLFGF
ncbi:P-loop NTPase [Haloarcula marina]|uniref:P-loop NTPase n=1 Tax=Haloarcula marina TaxID=2961574 RepID=UPI0020B7D13F|nr:P-loop NTPase [Halomicroarcula marina]